MRRIAEIKIKSILRKVSESSHVLTEIFLLSLAVNICFVFTYIGRRLIALMCSSCIP